MHARCSCLPPFPFLPLVLTHFSTSLQGTFRATFEDKILMSDIVFCRTWVPVDPQRFYNPVCSLLSDKPEWEGAMKTTAQVGIMEPRRWIGG